MKKPPIQARDLTGHLFGRLTVIGRAPNRVDLSERVRVAWVCKCECGGERTIRADVLCKEGGTRSCGCLQQEHGSTLNRKTLAQQRDALLASVIKSPNGCWSVPEKTWRRYGQVHAEGAPWLAHRLIWTLEKGAIPKGMFVLHDCDNPRCINPRHLRLGDTRQNAIEAVQRNRNSRQKLDVAKAFEIKRQNGLKSAALLATEYGVCQQTIKDIWRGRSWGHAFK